MCKLRARNPVAHQPKLFSAPSSAPPRRSSSLAGADLTRHARNVPQGQSRRETEPEREEKFRPREKATAPIHAEEGLSRPPRAWIIRDKYLRARGARCSFIGKRNAPAHDAACSRANRATRACRDRSSNPRTRGGSCRGHLELQKTRKLEVGKVKREGRQNVI